MDLICSMFYFQLKFNTAYKFGFVRRFRYFSLSEKPAIISEILNKARNLDRATACHFNILYKIRFAVNKSTNRNFFICLYITG